MASYNRVILLGNLTRDPELRYTSSGMAIAKIGLAVNRVSKTQTGETKEEVTFVDVSAFGKQAEVIGQYLKKGRPLFMEGRLRLETWDDKQTGQKRSRLCVVLESFQFVDSGKRQEGGESEPPRRQTSAPPPPASSSSSDEQSDEMPPEEEDDVPF